MADSPPSQTAASSSSLSNASSSSLYRRRNGLSPRQRRLLQASARAKASSVAQNATAANNAARIDDGASVITESGPLSSPWSSLPAAATSTSSPPTTAVPSPAWPAESRSITPAELKVPLSPITHHCSKTSSPSKLSAGGGSGASTAVLTEATTASIENGIRRRLQLKNPTAQTNEPIGDIAPNNDRKYAGDEVNDVTKAMRGKVSDRIRALNNQGSLPAQIAQTGSSTQHGLQEFRDHSIRSSNCMIMNREQSSTAAQNRKFDGLEWKDKRRAQRTNFNSAYLGGSRVYTGNQSIGESIEEETKKSINNGPLHAKILEEERINSPIQEDVRKLSPFRQKVIDHPNTIINHCANSPHSIRRQFKLQSSQQQRFPSDEIESDGDLQYYRIKFKGVVSLLSELDADAGLMPHGASKMTFEQGDTRSRHYVGYGEIVATYSPEITIPINQSEKKGRMAGHVSETQFVRAIRVDSILTGGYAVDASSQEAVQHGVAKSQNNWLNSMKNESNVDSYMEHRKSHYGYLLLSHPHSSSNPIIAEPLPMVISEFLCSSTETGSFLYRVTASSPISVLSGPFMDAAGLGLGLLPGTVHEVTLRISIPITQQGVDLDGANDTLVDDGDGGEVKFLRLGQRRGWVPDRKIDAVNQKLRVLYLLQDVTNDENGSKGLLNNNSLIDESPLPIADGLFDDALLSVSVEGDTSSLNSSALNSTANSSFYSSIVASSVATPKSVKSQRRRNRRRSLAAGGGMEWSQQPAMSLPSLVRENQCRVGSFEEAGSSITGGGTDVACDVDGDCSSNAVAQIQPTKSYYLMRVLAPLGLKILDSPNFQVSSLIHSPSPTKKNPRNSPTTTSPFARTNAMIGSLSAESSPSSVGARKRGSPRVRLLPRGQIFEASQRMERGSLYTNGQGLIKLADGSGWAIVPHEEDLITQFKNFHGDVLFDKTAAIAFEEIGNCSIGVPIRQLRLTPQKQVQENASEQTLKGIVWLRIAAPPNGIKVLLPPPQKLDKKDSHSTPPKYVDNQTNMNLSTSHDSEVASSVVSSSIFDSVWSRVTPSKEKERNGHPSIQGRHSIAAKSSLKQQQPMLPVIPCGTVVPVERWDPSTTSKKSFARLFNGQGWIPRCLGDVLYAYLVDAPDIRVGSFWFRVKSRSGLDVRHGPSHNAPVIKSDNDASFRFECGEFLRASEIMTISNASAPDEGSSDGATECFAKLYRRRNHLNNENIASQAVLDQFSSLHSLTSPGEWIQVQRNGKLFVEECSTAPRIERNRVGLQYMVICAELNIHCGPSLQADVIGVLMCEGEVLVSEKVIAYGEEATWLRLKSGGWVCSMRDDVQTVMQATRLPTYATHGEHLVRQIKVNDTNMCVNR